MNYYGVFMCYKTEELTPNSIREWTRTSEDMITEEEYNQVKEKILKIIGEIK